MEELKPCPFCGGEANQLVKYYSVFHKEFGIFCKECKCQTNFNETMEEARKIWNTRKEV